MNALEAAVARFAEELRAGAITPRMFDKKVRLARQKLAPALPVLDREAAHRWLQGRTALRYHQTQTLTTGFDKNLESQRVVTAAACAALGMSDGGEVRDRTGSLAHLLNSLGALAHTPVVVVKSASRFRGGDLAETTRTLTDLHASGVAVVFVDDGFSTLERGWQLRALEAIRAALERSQQISRGKRGSRASGEGEVMSDG